MKFKSKIDRGIHFLFLVFTLGSAFFIYKQIQNLGVYSFFSLVITGLWVAFYLLILVPIYFFTDYRIKGNDLTIRCGLVANATIQITRIVALEFNHNPEMACALSLDRICLVFLEDNDEKTYTLVSPKEQEKFVLALLKQNPYIDIRNGNKKQFKTKVSIDLPNPNPKIEEG